MDDFYANLDSILDDPRSVEAKERDYKTSDLIPTLSLPNWVEKEEIDWKKYTPRNQSTSLSCMAQASAKGYEVINLIKNKVSEVFSAQPPYRSRVNYPSGGMWLQNLLDIMKNIGTNYESVAKSQNIDEEEINRDVTCETPFKITGYGFPDKQNDIDDIALAIEKYGHCIILIHANKKEYTRPIPEYKGDEVDFGHGVCATDYFIYKDKKVIKIEDSTGHSSTLDKKGTRLLTEDFLLKRCSASGYMILGDVKYIFKTFMRKGYISNEVKELQKRLNKELGISLVIDGKFGIKTDEAVKLYQKKNGLVADGLVGVKTRQFLNATSSG